MRFSLLLFFLVLGQTLCAFDQNAPPVAQADKSDKDTVIGKAIFLPIPVYSTEARAARIHGQVQIMVLIAEDGSVVSSKAVSGPELLWASAETAALRAKFTPTTISGRPVKTTGRILFTFIQTVNWENIGAILGGLELGKLVTANYKQWEKQIVEDIGDDAKDELFNILRVQSPPIDAVRAGNLATKIENILLKNQPVEGWYFQLGRIRSALDESAGKPEKRVLFEDSLKKLKVLAYTAPLGTPPYRVDPLVTIAVDFSDGSNLTTIQQQSIVNMLIESYNRVPMY